MRNKLTKANSELLEEKLNTDISKNLVCDWYITEAITNHILSTENFLALKNKKDVFLK